MMKSIQPSPQLPALSATRGPNSGMPARSSKAAARNLTGVYLGSENSGNSLSRPKQAVPPLARVRGTRRVKTPIEERRYRMVELHRIKEDKQGFTGQLLKRRAHATRPVDSTHQQPPCTAPASTVSRHPPVPQEYMDVWQLTRKTPRHFTAATNSGVTHMEYLDIQHEDQPSRFHLQQQLAASLAHQFQSQAASKQEVEGLVQCYRKVCKGNSEALLSLLPLKKHLDSQKKHAQRYTGFAVKSYRNPNKAQIVAEFPTPETRPRTTLGNFQRPLVPNPYFFKLYNPPRTAAPGACQPVEGHFGLPYSDQILPVPGAGTLSRSLTRTYQQSADIRANTPVDQSSRIHPLEDSAAEGSQPKSREASNTPEHKVKIPHPEVDEPAKSNQPENPEQTNQEQEDINNSTKAVVANMAEAETEMGSQRDRINSGTDIMIGLVDESGANAPVEIDETDEEIKGTVPEAEHADFDEEPPIAPTLNRRVSITERILKTKNSEQQMQKLVEENAKKRKQELANLLDEHETIIAEIATMETPCSGDENENQPPQTSLEKGK